MSIKYTIAKVKYLYKERNSNQLDYDWGESIGWISLENNLPSNQEDWKKYHYEFDENMVFNCDGFKELQTLMNIENDEDIYVSEILEIKNGGC